VFDYLAAVVLLNVFVFVCTRARACVYKITEDIYIIYININIYIYIYIYIYVYLYIFIYIYMSLLLTNRFLSYR